LSGEREPDLGSGSRLARVGFAVTAVHRQDVGMNWFTGRSTGKHDVVADPARAGDALIGGAQADHAQAEEAGAPPEAPVRMTAWVHGMVQGVGFRWWTRSRALELGLVGSAKNLLDGRVEIVVEGEKAACDNLVQQLRAADTPGRVEHVEVTFSAARGQLRGFVER
jgi:acylphosphatase